MVEGFTIDFKQRVSEEDAQEKICEILYSLLNEPQNCFEDLAGRELMDGSFSIIDSKDNVTGFLKTNYSSGE